MHRSLSTTDSRTLGVCSFGVTFNERYSESTLPLVATDLWRHHNCDRRSNRLLDIHSRYQCASATRPIRKSDDDDRSRLVHPPGRSSSVAHNTHEQCLRGFGRARPVWHGLRFLPWNERTYSDKHWEIDVSTRSRPRIAGSTEIVEPRTVLGY